MNEDISVHHLLIQLKHKDDRAIEVLYRRYAREFYTCARRKGLIHQDAEDIVQASFDRVLECISGYKEAAGGGEGWMRTICNHLIIDFLRRKQLERFSELSEELLSSESTDPEICFDRKERFEAFKWAWEEISEADRAELRRGRGRGLGRNAWHEARKRLKAYFEKRNER